MFDWLLNLAPPAKGTLTDSLLTAYVLLDVFLIVVLARILGTLMARIKQPRVVGEILAGVLLGPTLLGSNLSLVVAPADARPVVSAIATLGLIFFMFLAGVEFDASRVAPRMKQAGLLAVLSVAVPAFIGFPLAQLMHTSTYAGPAGQDILPFGLFIGAALSVTAFPVMAHILMERGELNSPMGGLGVASTGIMSILMFTYIAFAGAMASPAGPGAVLVQIGEIIVFALVSWFVVRPLLARMLPGDAKVNATHMAIILAGMVLYGLIGDRIGINALVGGFAFGLILPDSTAFRQEVAAKVKDVTLVFLLPVFFAQAGFAADLKLLTPDTFLVVVLVLLAAVGGKFLAVVPAKAFGLTWNETGILGALTNARGLLVLVAGLIGLQLQIITNLTFTIIVVVALVTNLMTLPLLNLFTRRLPAPAAVRVSPSALPFP